MSETNFRKLTGIFFIVGAILVNIPFALLIVNFDSPDILRQPTAEVLTRFQAGGDILIYTWLASSGSLRSSPAALLATQASSANADAEDATPEGKLFSLITSGVLLYAAKLV